MKTNRSEFSEKITAEQIKIIYSNLPVLTIGAALVAITSCFVLEYIKAQHDLALEKSQSWLACQFIILNLVLLFYFLRHFLKKERYKWQVWMGMNICAIGLIMTALLFTLHDIKTPSEVLAYKLQIWLILYCLTSIFILLLCFAYHYLKHIKLQLWATAIILAFGLLGMVWGLASILLPQSPHYDEQQLWMVLFVDIGISFVASFAFSSYLPVVYAFMLSAILPQCLLGVAAIYFKNTTILSHFLQNFDKPLLTLLGFLCFIFIFYSSRLINRIFYNELKLRFEQQALKDKLNTTIILENDAVADKKRFLDGVVHDLRQPIFVLHLTLKSLHQYCLDKNISPSTIEKMQSATNDIRYLVDDLFFIIQMEANTIKHDKSLQILMLVREKAAVEEEKNYLCQHYSVFVISSSAELFTYNQNCQKAPNLIICDQLLYEQENAIEVIEILCENYNRDIPALLLIDNMALTTSYETISLLKKPFTLEELAGRVARLLILS